ncbi:hypothetical protein [Saccharopolyspora rectivirgula]|uniref:Uncharacterized protein n=1 Tax=Saccharopolyspora rectivirgula TaxID=28042 RepID=A0A073B2Q0_9PSEU|nr:hypothetical protein [Saccharopolyspora rectivirgula]KEI45552.1 hypothetical protein GU90_03715 [Saccharopolyspora rectivirgula]
MRDGRPDRPGSKRSKKRPSIAEIFGDVLPDTTSDDRPDPGGQQEMERWYRENRPPHHDPR